MKKSLHNHLTCKDKECKWHSESPQETSLKVPPPPSHQEIHGCDGKCEQVYPVPSLEWEEIQKEWLEKFWGNPNYIDIDKQEAEEFGKDIADWWINKLHKVESNALARGREEVIDIITDEATGAGCLKKKWNCCGYHDACEDILKRVNALKDKVK